METTTVPHNAERRSPPLRNSFNGLDHETPSLIRLRFHPHDYRPRLFQSGPFYPMQGEDGNQRACRNVFQKGLPSLWNSWENHLRPRSKNHVPTCQGYLYRNRNPTEHQHCLPSTNGWSIRTNESDPRNIPTNILQRTTDRLG